MSQSKWDKKGFRPEAKVLALGKSVESSSMKTKGKYMRWVKELGSLGLVADDFSFPIDLPVENGGL